MKKVFLVLVVLIVGLALYVWTRPGDYRVQRTAAISAPAEIIFDHINDFHEWEEWSPWEKLDPAMKKTFEGPSSGTGAVYAWSGNDKVGSGKMTITESAPNEKVVIRLEFIKPFASTNTATFALKPAGPSTEVTWTMEGRNSAFIAKAFAAFANMDKMIGSDFERGLATLKEKTEGDAKEAAAKEAAEKEAAAAKAPPAKGAAPKPAAKGAKPS